MDLLRLSIYIINLLFCSKVFAVPTCTLVLDSIDNSSSGISDTVKIYYSMVSTDSISYKISNLYFSTGDTSYCKYAGPNSLLDTYHQDTGRYALYWNSLEQLTGYNEDNLYIKCRLDSKFPVEDSNIIAYWNFNTGNGNAIMDITGNMNYGVVHGPIWNLGVEGGALHFNGKKDYVNIGDKCDIGSNDFTLAAWVRLDTLTVYSYMSIANKDASIDGYSFGVSKTRHIFGYIGYQQKSWSRSPDDGDTLSFGKWHHIAVVFNRNGEMVRYLNGKMTGTNIDISKQAGIITNQASLYLGNRELHYPYEMFPGSIDDLYIIKQALDSIEINYLINKSLKYYSNYVTAGPLRLNNCSACYDTSQYITECDIILSDTITELKSTPEGLAALDKGGYSVAIDNKSAIVGMYNENNSCRELSKNGFAYTYYFSDGEWKLGNIIIGNEYALGEGFGYDVAVSGNYSVISTARQPFIYVFKRAGQNWIPHSKLFASDSVSLGRKVDICGDFIITGNNGFAYIFKRSTDDIWKEQCKLTPEDSITGNRFGSDVAICNDFAIVGAQFDQTKGLNVGAVYTYTNNDSTWDFKEKVYPEDCDSLYNSKFGNTVDIIDSTFAATFLAGASYVFKYEDESWKQKIKIITEDTLGSYIGNSIALEKNILAVRCINYKGEDRGAVKLYRYLDEKWTMGKIITASDTGLGDQFGYNIGIYNNQLLVGAPWDDDNGGGSGSVYFYTIGDLRCDSSYTNISRMVNDNPNKGIELIIYPDWTIDIIGLKDIVAARIYSLGGNEIPVNVTHGLSTTNIKVNKLVNSTGIYLLEIFSGSYSNKMFKLLLSH